MFNLRSMYELLYIRPMETLWDIDRFYHASRTYIGWFTQCGLLTAADLLIDSYSHCVRVCKYPGSLKSFHDSTN